MDTYFNSQSATQKTQILHHPYILSQAPYMDIGRWFNLSTRPGSVTKKGIAHTHNCSVHCCVALNPRSITSKIHLTLSVAVKRYKDPHQHLDDCIPTISVQTMSNADYSSTQSKFNSSLSLPSPRSPVILPVRTMDMRVDASRSLEEKRNEDDEWELDPNNPHNWSTPRKWTSLTIVSLYAAVPIFATAIIAPALPEIAKQFHVHNSTITSLILSVTLLTHIFGPLVVPLSEMYGRIWVLTICSIFAVIFNLGSAFAPNTGTLIAFRALYGIAASAPPDVSIGVVSDIFPPKHRATPVAVYQIAGMTGTFIGPVVGGFMAQRSGPKWLFVLLAALWGALTILGGVLLRETYPPVIRMRLAKQENNLDKAARVHPMLLDSHTDILTLFRINITRPLELLFHSFICFILCLFEAILYGFLYLLLTSFPELFSRTYGFKPGGVGLAYSGLSFGFTFAMVVGGKWADYVYNHLAEKKGGKGKPEMRMPLVIPGAISVCMGLLWYGWSAQAKLHWIMPIIGSAIFGFGLMTAVLAITLYLTDAFTYAASALAAASIVRSIIGFTFPLFGKQMYNALGQGGANSLLAGIAMLFGIPFPIWIYYNGQAFRAKSPLTICT